jgi:chorismate mutase
MSGNDRPFSSPSPSTAEFERELETLRQRIDTIDTQLLGLLNARAAVVADIYALKGRHGIRRLDRTRSDAILDRLANASAGPLLPQDVRAIFGSLLEFFVERYAPPDESAREGEAAGN